ncbi:zeta toxin family protein [Streptomyces sp. NPDC001389]|uniref:zeta toxin family protein n=1 Tax=Streptomyces sp. NPDC001389 TaxID=3364569 RepID=UPI00369B4A3E
MTPQPTTEGQLPIEVNRRIFQEEIVPDFLEGCTPRRRPVFVIVAGQTGAGKSAVTSMVKDALDRDGRAAWINMDFYNPHHPEYAHWQAERPEEADALVRPDGDRWWEQAQEYALSRGFDVLLESAMVSPAEFEDICRRVRAARLPDGVAPYRIEVAFVAVAGPVSLQGITTRYLDELRTRGHGRLVDPAIHDAALAGVLRGAAALEREALGDYTVVLRRGGDAIHTQHLDVLSPKPDRLSLVEAIEREHTRVQTASEAALFTARHSQAVLTAPDFLLPELDRIARAAAPLMPAPTAVWTNTIAQAAALRATPDTRPEDPTLLPHSTGAVTGLLAHSLAAQHAAASEQNQAVLTRHEHASGRLLGELARRHALTSEGLRREDAQRRALIEARTRTVAEPRANLPARVSAAAARSRSSTTSSRPPAAAPRPATPPRPRPGEGSSPHQTRGR